MQLDAAIVTLERHLSLASIPNISVIYAFSNVAFREGYVKLIDNCCTPVEWIEEKDFHNQVLDCVERCYEYTMFYCDDCMMFAPAFFVILPDDVLCYAFSLGRNTVYSYPISRAQVLPVDFPIWKYQEADGDFAYPFALTGHVYRTDDILDVIGHRNWDSPNMLEASMVGAPSKYSYMMAPDHSCSVTIPHNIVQSHFANRYEGGTAKSLNDRFLVGERIDPFAMDFSKVVGAHQSIPFVFREASRG